MGGEKNYRDREMFYFFPLAAAPAPAELTGAAELAELVGVAELAELAGVAELQPHFHSLEYHFKKRQDRGEG